ncbi:hypothetical protein ACP70R_020736 [Stipagrostis hirtigluma subsp. patula]
MARPFSGLPALPPLLLLLFLLLVCWLRVAGRLPPRLLRRQHQAAGGLVVAFYMSSGDVNEKTHDELDFEFLGNIRGRQWRVQTNVYGNGSTSVGREER